jgi:hypothetical protein
MKTIKNTIIIGIDHGYGNIKTANFITPTGITAYDTEPLFSGNILVYDGIYYRIGEGHKAFIPDKATDNDFYILTLNIMYVNNKKPVESRCYTEKQGVNQCVIAARNAVMDSTGIKIDESVIENVIRTGTADIGKKYLDIIVEVARNYSATIFETLRKYEYNSELMKLFIVGGGGCIIRNFGEYVPDRVTIIPDICATAKGYEQIALNALRNGVRCG